MGTSCRRKRTQRLPPPGLSALGLVSSLAVLVQQGQAFNASNMFTSRAALRRLSACAVRKAATTQQRQLAINHHGSAFSMVWGDNRQASRRGRQADRRFSNGGVADKSFMDDTGNRGGTGRADTHTSSDTDRGSGGRLSGGWTDTYGSGGSGDRRQRRSDGSGWGGKKLSGSYGGRDGHEGSGSGGGGRYDRRSRGRGMARDQAVGSRGRRGGGEVERGRGSYDGNYGEWEAGSRGGSSPNWDDNRGRGRGARGRGRGGGRYGKRDGSNGGRQSNVGRRETTGRGSRTHGGTSQAWNPDLGGSQVYADEDEGYGGDEEVVMDDWAASQSSPASDWMRGELSGYQAELSPGAKIDEDTNFDMVYGIAPVLNALRNTRREKLELYCQDGLAPANKKDRAAANQIYDLTRETDVSMTTTDKGYLNTLCGNRPHQGFVLKARPLQFEPILYLPRIEGGAHDDESAAPPRETTAPALADSAPPDDDGDDNGEEEEDASLKKQPAPLAAAATGQVWLALDEVTDPQNFGALLRSAHFFGASGVVTCAKNSASMTATVSKSSAGAVEVMRVHSTANMMRFLKRSRENGWRVVGTSVSERSAPLHELPAGPGAPPTIVVLGNEGYGVRTNVLKECEFLVEVAGDGGGAVAEGATPSTVDSLNVSVTGGVVLFHLLAGAKHAAAYMSAAASAE